MRSVILYGDSLILQGVRTSLSTCAGIQLLQLDPGQESPLRTLQKRCPAVFIFDLSDVQPDFQLALLQIPGLVLVGIDPGTQQAWVWSGRQAAAAVASDLFSVVLGDAPASNISAAVQARADDAPEGEETD